VVLWITTLTSNENVAPKVLTISGANLNRISSSSMTFRLYMLREERFGDANHYDLSAETSSESMFVSIPADQKTGSGKVWARFER
jgi:hypothetical protein